MKKCIKIILCVIIFACITIPIIVNYEYIVLQYEKAKIIDSEKFVHISIDDFIEAFRDITINQNKYNSIFDNKLFKELKYLNNTYGMVISCYTYYENNEFNLSMCTDKFSEEFKQNSEWLKFGFHAHNAKSDYNQTEAIKEDYEKTIKELLRITGTKDCIDTVIRLHGYKGNENAIKSIINIENGIKGLLGADDNRNSYYLNNEQSNQLMMYDYFKDKNNINYFKTDIRIENILNIEETLKQINLTKSTKNNEILIIFTHEWKIYEDKSTIEKMKEICKQVLENGYVFDYPMERID